MTLTKFALKRTDKEINLKEKEKASITHNANTNAA
jgi:hypothetical protein